ncbi:MAG: signal peptide peptidase SppA, partial [Bacteroidota bacterium]
MKFLRNFLAALSALVVFSVFSLIIFFGMIAALEDTEKFTVKDNTVLKISLTQPLSDRDFEDPFADMSFLGGEVDRIGVVNLRKALNQAANDDKIKGVVLYAPSLMGGFALGQEARKALEDFKSSGKF